jgi:hypothetical protein
VRKLDTYLSERRIHGQQRDLQARKIVRDYCRMIEQSADIQQASPSLKRAAQASKYLMRVRYNPYRSEWYAAWNFLMADLACPQCRHAGTIVRHLFYYPIRKRLSWMRQSNRRALS